MATLAAVACADGAETTDPVEATDHTDAPPPPACPQALEGGELLRVLPFLGEDDQAVGERVGSELNGRLAFDHSGIGPDDTLVSNEAFFIRTLPPASLPNPQGWALTVEGAGGGPLDLEELLDQVEDQGAILLECSGNRENRHFGLISSATWAGIPLDKVWERLDLDAGTTRVEIGGFDAHTQPSTSTPGCSWIFTLDELAEAGAFLATEMNGEPLPRDHGAPVRLLVPGWYGCCSAKWVDTLRFVGDDAPATPQMMEFASRTHQRGTPRLARDYQPATMQLSAMPLRVEVWDVGGTVMHRIIGMAWGGGSTRPTLELRTDTSQPWRAVEWCAEERNPRTWAFWQLLWEPERAGTHVLEMRSPEEPSIRLELGWYTRAVEV